MNNKEERIALLAAAAQWAVADVADLERRATCIRRRMNNSLRGLADVCAAQTLLAKADWRLDTLEANAQLALDEAAELERRAYAARERIDETLRRLVFLRGWKSALTASGTEGGR